MEGGRQSGRPNDELFLGRASSPSVDSPTVGPLRINKANSPGPSSRSASAMGAKDSYQQNPLVQPSAGGPPYPDDRSHTPAARQATPLSGRANAGTSDVAEEPRQRKTSTPQPGSRIKFEANDPNRPTLSAYTQSPVKQRGGERRNGSTPKPLPDSPGPETPEKDQPGLGGRMRSPELAMPSSNTSQASPSAQQYYPPPADATAGQLNVPEQSGVNRFSSTASTSTTRAQRGSPPPPETPVGERLASGRFGSGAPATLSSLQAQNAAAAQRVNPYAPIGIRPGTVSPPQQPQSAPQRPWSPSERPGPHPYGPTAVYQGMHEVAEGPNQQANVPPSQSTQAQQSFQQQVGQSLLSGQDMQRLNLHEEPPPAYSSVTQAGRRTTPGPTTAQGYPDEKRTSAGGSSLPSGQMSPGLPQDSNMQRHPAFANDPQTTPSVSPQPGAHGLAPLHVATANSTYPGPSAGPSSPPPLPEGWIAHLDQNSGQYYYIHLPTQSTQWEFPKGPMPLNMQEPLSPTGTFVNPLTSPIVGTFSGKPMASPGFPTQTIPYRDSMMSMASTVATPTTTGFTGPPPSAGVDMYRIVPTNGVYFGPYLRYTNIDLERGLWLGSILLVTDTPQPPTIHIHQSVDLSPNPRQLKANPIYSHQRWLFYRYDIDVLQEEHPAKWTYAITSHLGCTRYEFLVAGRYEPSWRFIAHSGNDFAMGVSANERARLGGISVMWKDVLQKHVECGGFHAQLGLGGQIYADRMWQDIPMLRQWTTMSGKEARKNAPWTAKHEEDVLHAYFHYYTSHFDQPHLREAFAQIPHILQMDDHDIFDGYGSYPDYMQQSNMFRNIGRIGTDMYLLFQHHTTHEILRNVNNDLDLFTITGTGWHFLKYLGPAVVVVGPDTRSERNINQVLAGPTYQGLLPKVATLPASVQHCIWMIPVPLIYPRLHNAQQIANVMGTGKKAVTGTFNMLGKVTSSVAGIVGAKDVVNDGFHQVKKAVGKSGLMSGMLSPFGEIEAFDELRDMWTHETKDLERTYIIRTLQGISHNKSLRMTFLSGSVNSCGAGLVHDPTHPSDHKTMYQLITSSIVNAPPSSMVLRLLNTNPKNPLFVPPNGRRSNYSSAAPPVVTDTKEDMMEIFGQDVNGAPREMKRLMGRRNYIALVAYDPEVVQGAFGQTVVGHHNHHNGGGGSGKMGAGSLSLAADFMVQSDGYAAPVKFGPIIIPSLEYGR